MNRQEINITAVTQTGPHRLRLEFDDGTLQDIDFAPFLSHAQHPDLRAYLEEGLFKTYRLEHGELVWGEYDLCFPIIDLYQNQIEHGQALSAAA